MTEDSRRPRQAPAAMNPTPEERELHSLTRLPYLSWCNIGLRSKARGFYRKQQYGRPPLQAEYGSLIDQDTRQHIPVRPQKKVSGTTHSLNYDASCWSASVPEEYYKPIRKPPSAD